MSNVVRLVAKNAFATVFLKCIPPAAVQAVAIVIDEQTRNYLLDKINLFREVSGREANLESMTFMDTLPYPIIDPENAAVEENVNTAIHCEYAIEHFHVSNFQSSPVPDYSAIHVDAGGVYWTFQVGDAQYQTTPLSGHTLRSIKRKAVRA